MEELFEQLVAEEQVVTLVRSTYLVSVAILLHFVVRLWLVKLFNKLSRHTDQRWYRLIIQHKVIHRALFLLPLIVLSVGMEWVPNLPEDFASFISRMVSALMILVVARTLDAILEAMHTGYHELPHEDKRPIKSYIQMGKVIIYIICVILIIAQIADRSPWYFLSGLGAITAIVMLVFRDTLLSLVASVQITNNNLIKSGDWIEMNQFGADGPVIDIALNTVRVQNFDKTITVIPTHKFLEHSFRNWRGMQEAGGRRIRRWIHIDITSIRFLTLAEVERFKKSRFLSGYITNKLDDLNEFYKNRPGDEFSPLDARWLTNIGTFRIYAFEYLKAHPQINHDLMTLVRQHQPTGEGVPLELYAFTNDVRWVYYEQIQADIFDHMFAISSEFGLRLFQNPSGHDLRELMKGKKGN